MRLRKMINNLNTIVLTLKCDYEIMKDTLTLIKKQTEANRNNYKFAEQQLKNHWEDNVFPKLSEKREAAFIKIINVLENKLHKENVEQDKLITELYKFIDFTSVNRPKYEIGFTFDRYIISHIEPVSYLDDKIYYQYFIVDNKGFDEALTMLISEGQAINFINSFKNK